MKQKNGPNINTKHQNTIQPTVTVLKGEVQLAAAFFVVILKDSFMLTS